MNPLAQLREECQKLLEESLEKAYPETELPQAKYSEPPNPEMGALSSPVCFQLARPLRQSPVKIAQTLAKNIDTSSSTLIVSVEAVNGYLNFHTDIGNYASLVLKTVRAKDKEYGFLKSANPEKVMVEHTSANPISPLHIGNARNSILGDSLARLLDKRGHDVIRHFLVNDMGRQVAMTTYGWKLLGKPEPVGTAELWIGTIYASVNVINEIQRYTKDLREAEKEGWVYEAQEAQEELEKFNIAADGLRKRYADIYEKLSEIIPGIEDPTAEIVALNTAYENNDPTTVNEVRQQVKYCLDGFEKSLGDLDISFDSFDYESDLVWRQAAEEVLEALKKSGYVIKDQGAQILDCDWVARDFKLKERWGLHPKHEIPRLVLVRGDGTTLYTLRDMAYSIWKFSHAERVINVIGQEQTLAQLQLRIALAAIDKIEMGDNQRHYAYEFVNLPGIKMSGRLGRYVTLNEVLERAVALAYGEVEKRTSELSDEEKQNIAEMVGYGAVKYTLISVDPMKQVTFDWEKALNFETNSAPFIQYSHARTCNILKRVDETTEADYSQLTHIKERDLVNLLARFPETFVDAVEELQPADLTAYANNLADKFNSFYATQNVLKAETPELMAARLAIVDAVRITLRNALDVLGIKAPERM
ncbi:MAG: arginine--tRNA ligase [Candidatus Bathyarchaeota archaeon]|nr:arginine--tRNA ligase [Candidatus Bathyarchaeota archaeon]